VGAPLHERFATKWTPEPNTGCWLWTGAVGLNGYGIIWLDGNDNVADMIAKGRNSKGETHTGVKLSDEQVVEIRASTEPQTALAERYGVGQSQISRIRNFKRWKDG